MRFSYFLTITKHQAFQSRQLRYPLQTSVPHLSGIHAQTNDLPPRVLPFGDYRRPTDRQILARLPGLQQSCIDLACPGCGAEPDDQRRCRPHALHVFTSTQSEPVTPGKGGPGPARGTAQIPGTQTDW